MSLIIKTLISALTIVAISEIAKRSSLFAGLFASIPLTSFLAFIWLYWETNDSLKVVNLSNSIFLMIVPSLAFFIIFPIIIKMNISFWLSMIISLVVTASVYLLYLYILNKFNINL